MIGKIVLYHLTAADSASINRRRLDANSHLNEHSLKADGSIIHSGNPVNFNETFPMVVTKDNFDSVNGQVLLDGNDVLWVKNVTEGPGEGQYELLG